MKLRLYSIVIIAVLTLVVPAVFLRGTLPQQTATEIDGLAQFASMQGVSLGPVIWREGFNNASTWALSGSTPAILQLNNSLSLKIVFPSRTTAQALSIFHNVSLPLDQGPIVFLSVQVSGGISYGVRFWGVTATNKPFSAWHEGSMLQHRPGLGIFETVSANLVSESSIPNPTLSLAGARITRMAFYVEAVPLVSGEFSTHVSRGASIDPTTSRDLVFYFFVFLFIIPVAMVALVVKVFRDEH